MFTHFHLSYSINVKQMQNIWLPFCHRRNFGYEQYEMSIPIFGGVYIFHTNKIRFGDCAVWQCCGGFAQGASRFDNLDNIVGVPVSFTSDNSAPG